MPVFVYNVQLFSLPTLVLSLKILFPWQLDSAKMNLIVSIQLNLITQKVVASKLFAQQGAFFNS